MFEVVEDEQRAFVRQRGGERCQRRGIAPVGRTDCLGDRAEDEHWITQRPECGEADASGEIGRNFGGGLQRQAGLADAAGAGDGQQADIGPGEQLANHRHLALTADQVGQVAGQLGRTGGNWCGGRRRAWAEGGFVSIGVRAPWQCRDESSALRFVQFERDGERANRLWIGTLTLAALQGTDRLGGQSRALGEVFLREPGRFAQPPQLLPERCSLCHLPSMTRSVRQGIW